MQLTRAQAGLITQFCTGFCNMNHFSNKKDKRISPICRICQKDREKPWHIATSCDPILVTSRNLLESFHIDGTWSVKNLLSLTEDSRVRRLLNTRVVAV